MDVALHYADEYLFDSLYAKYLPSELAASISPRTLSWLNYGASLAAPASSTSILARDSILRQTLSLYAVAFFGAFALYFIISTLSYYLLFDRRLEHHPRFLKNQVRKEIILSSQAMPLMDALIVPWFVGEARGWTRMYDGFPSMFGMNGKVYAVVGLVVFLAVTDWCIYWIHRWLHIPWLYKRLHKPHHRWLVPTPFAAMAFHPVDGFAQSLPYHVLPYFIPMNKYVYVGMFVAVNIWTVFIHDGDMIQGTYLEGWINSPAHHTLHHLYFTVNYGQYTTFADKFGNSYRGPRPELDPIHAALREMERKEREKAEKAEKERIGGVGAGGVEKRERLEVVQEAEEGSDSGYEGSGKEEEEEKVLKKSKGEVRKRK